MAEIDLTGPQRAAVLGALLPYADRFEAVAVYGSRAQGRARPGSDIDLVVFGAADGDVSGELQEALDGSDLSIFADVVDFATIAHQQLRDEIRRHAQILYGRDDFIDWKGLIT